MGDESGLSDDVRAPIVRRFDGPADGLVQACLNGKGSLTELSEAIGFDAETSNEEADCLCHRLQNLSLEKMKTCPSGHPLVISEGFMSEWCDRGGEWYGGGGMNRFVCTVCNYVLCPQCSIDKIRDSGVSLGEVGLNQGDNRCRWWES